MALDSPIVLIPSRTDTADTTIVATDRASRQRLNGVAQWWLDCLFILKVTAAGTDATDLLDITIRHSWNAEDLAPGWDEFVAFLQVAGDATTPFISYAQWNRTVNPETEARVPNTTLAAGNVVQGPIGPDLSVGVDITSGNSASFTWELLVAPYSAV